MCLQTGRKRPRICMTFEENALQSSVFRWVPTQKTAYTSSPKQGPLCQGAAAAADEGVAHWAQSIRQIGEREGICGALVPTNGPTRGT